MSTETGTDPVMTHLTGAAVDANRPPLAPETERAIAPLPNAKADGPSPFRGALPYRVHRSSRWGWSNGSPAAAGACTMPAAPRQHTAGGSCGRWSVFRWLGCFQWTAGLANGRRLLELSVPTMDRNIAPARPSRCMHRPPSAQHGSPCLWRRGMMGSSPAAERCERSADREVVYRTVAGRELRMLIFRPLAPGPARPAIPASSAAFQIDIMTSITAAMTAIVKSSTRVTLVMGRLRAVPRHAQRIDRLSSNTSSTPRAPIKHHRQRHEVEVATGHTGRSGKPPPAKARRRGRPRHRPWNAAQSGRTPGRYP